MKISTLRKTLPMFIAICALALASSAALAQEKTKGKAKGKDKLEARGKHGREAGELPYGLVRHTEKGELPSGLQKNKDEDGQLTRGLSEGGKSSKSRSKVKKGLK
jgi:hypothetical protein